MKLRSLDGPQQVLLAFRKADPASAVMWCRILLAPEEQGVATVQTPNEQRFLLRNVDWPRYRAFAEALGEAHVRLTYDRGNLEFMTLSHGHERWSKLLGQFIEVLTEELNLPRQSGGSTTFDRADLERGLEPDQCYYLSHEPLVRNKDEIDLT